MSEGRTHSRRGAFTLVEVMVAMVIVLMAAVVLGGAYINVLQGYQHAARATQVNANLNFARDILLHVAEREDAEEGGDFRTVEGATIDWKATIEPTEVADLFEVTLQVQLPAEAGGEDEVVEERFRLLRPSWSEDDEREQLRQEARDRIEEFVRDREARR